jgi:hypothetical protein
VHDDRGWHLPPFVDLGESFYSIVGDYEVTLDVPADLDTPTSGVEVGGETSATRRITTYRAEDVRDFTWAAGRLSELTRRSGETAVRIWYRPAVNGHDRARQAARDARASMDTFSAAFGTFPYPEVDVILTGFTTFGGMEYPTIVFSDPSRLTIAHELAHQWWYGIVGDDQFTEPWLDESFATWSQHLPFEPWVGCDGVTFPSEAARITNDMGYWRGHRDEYWVVYQGGGCLLADLADRFGLDRFVQILRGHAAGSWLGVARTSDFTTAIEAAAIEDALPGFDPGAFWRAWRVDRSPGDPARIGPGRRR